MEQDGSARRSAERSQPFCVFILSEIRLLAEGLCQALEHDGQVSLCSSSTDVEDGLAKISELQPAIVLLDAQLQDGLGLVWRILRIAPRVKVIVFAVAETSDNAIPWAEAGVAGYIPRTAALADVVGLAVTIMQDRQVCSSGVASGLLRRLSHVANIGRRVSNAPPVQDLTVREVQVTELLAAGFSNKEIARNLKIGVATTKSHVHNVLGKLRVQRRGQAALWMRDRQTVAHASQHSPDTRPRA